VLRLAPLLLAALPLALGCSAGSGRGQADGAGAAGAAGQGGSGVQMDGGSGASGGGFVGDPVSCEHAKDQKTYVGCDFWPTVLPNVVGEHFDYAVVVANNGEVAASVQIERGGQPVQSAEVPPGGLAKIFLPWVDELKHYTGLCDTDPSPGFSASARLVAGAYHLTSSAPVIVYQFNPIEYAGQGGPDGKSWDACQACMFGCNSYSNDASLLLPSTALTGDYVVTAQSGMDTDEYRAPGYISLTGLQDGTQIAVRLSSTGRVVAGGGLGAAGPGELIELSIARGEVVQLLGTPETDLAGTLIQADKPVEVMTGSPCIYAPFDRQACDHIEETVFPVQTLGKHYLVARPTGPKGAAVGHIVRLYGAADGTALSYPSGAPPGAPASLDAGQVHDLGVVEQDFEVAADQPFAVASFMLGSSVVDPLIGGNGNGDPSQTNIAGVEQYRTKYVFLAPDDYAVSFADVVMPNGAEVQLDGAPIGVPLTPVGSDFAVARLPLAGGGGGAHVLVADVEIGLQVMGYGFATSYHYPGGLNLKGIAPPLPPLK